MYRSCVLPKCIYKRIFLVSNKIKLFWNIFLLIKRTLVFIDHMRNTSFWVNYVFKNHEQFLAYLPYVNVYCIENNKANEDTFVTFITNFAAFFKLITLLIQSCYYTHKVYVLAIPMPTLFFSWYRFFIFT